MTGSAWTRWTLHRVNIIYQGEGFGEGNGAAARRMGGRRIFLEGPGGVFLRIFFVSGFGEDFSWILEGFWRPKLVPKPIFNVFFAMPIRRGSWSRLLYLFKFFFPARTLIFVRTGEVL